MHGIVYHRLAGTLTCPLTVQNVGNVPFADVAVNGNDNNCSAVMLGPGQTMQCNMWGGVNASTTTHGLAATSVNGTAWGAAAQPKVPVARVVVANPAAANATAVLVVSVSTNVSVISRPGEAVLVTFTLVSCLWLICATMQPVLLAYRCAPQLPHTPCRCGLSMFASAACVNCCQGAIQTIYASCISCHHALHACFWYMQCDFRGISTLFVIVCCW